MLPRYVVTEMSSWHTAVKFMHLDKPVFLPVAVVEREDSKIPDVALVSHYDNDLNHPLFVDACWLVDSAGDVKEWKRCNRKLNWRNDLQVIWGIDSLTDKLYGRPI